MIWKFRRAKRPSKLKPAEIDEKTRLNLAQNAGLPNRKLEIGPGEQRIAGFETLNIVDSPATDYILDAASKLPFEDGTFDVVYASHILEHIPWYQTTQVLSEWARIIKKGGWLEVWVPDGLKIAKAFVEAEAGNDYTADDGWYKFNEQKDPCIWAAGRIFTYGDGEGTIDHPNWHRALFSPRYLKQCLEQSGFGQVASMSSKEVRATDHGWINLGVKGQKL